MTFHFIVGEKKGNCRGVVAVVLVVFGGAQNVGGRREETKSIVVSLAEILAPWWRSGVYSLVDWEHSALARGSTAVQNVRRIYWWSGGAC